MRCELLEPAIAMIGWMFDARASLMAKVPRELEAP